MKKLNFIATLVCACLAMSAKAQVPNSSFELINASGGISNWSSNVLISISIDSLGHADSLVIDSALYFSTTDAHSGSKAMEMRNAYNFTAGAAYAGAAVATTSDSDYAFFMSMIPVTSAPDTFSFYYKYFPAGSETGYGTMLVYDSTGNELGAASIAVPAAATYTHALAAVTYTMTGTPAFVAIRFSTCAPGQTPVLGTRLLVDDVASHGGGSGTAGLAPMKIQKVTCYPVPAKDVLNLLPGQNGTDKYTVTVTDVAGRTVLRQECATSNGVAGVNIAELPTGRYFIKAICTGHGFTGMFEKQ